MADKYPLANGDWSNAANWNGGTKPTSADDVFADGKTVQIDENATILSIRTTARSGGTAGGGFVLQSGVTLACTSGGVMPGSSTVITFSAASPGTATINSNCHASTTTTNINGVVHSGTGTLSITGNITSGNNTGRVGVLVSSTGTLNVLGNLINSGIGSVAHAVNVIGNATININGNLVHPEIGVAYSGTGLPLYVAATATVTIIGNVTAGNANSVATLNGCGLYQLAGTLTITGSVYGGLGQANTNGHGLNLVAVDCTVNGDIVAGTNDSSSGRGAGIYSSGGSTIAVNGDITATATNGVYLTHNNDKLIHNGTATASATREAIYHNAAGTLILSKMVNTQGNPAYGTARTTKVYLLNTGEMSHVWTTSDNVTQRALYTAAFIGGNPSQADVRNGTTYGPANELTGTLAVPPAASVGVGVPVDNTVGTAAITEQSIRDAINTIEFDTNITLEKVMEMLAAFIAGKVIRSSSEGVTTLIYKKRDGITTSFTCVANEDDGDRDTTGALS